MRLFARVLRKLHSLFQRYVYRQVTEILLLQDLQKPVAVRIGDRLTVEPVESRHYEGVRTLARRVSVGAPSSIEHAIYRRYLGFVAVIDGRVVGYTWCVTGRDVPHPDLDRYQISLADRDVYMYNLFLDPNHRGAGRGTELVLKVEAALRRAGFQRTWVWVDVGNLPSRTLVRTLGHNEIRQVASFRFLGWFLWMNGHLYVRSRDRDPARYLSFRRLF